MADIIDSSVSGIKDKIPSQGTLNTISRPKYKNELAKVSKLNSKNYITTTTDASGNIVEQSKPDKIVNQEIEQAVVENEPDIKNCITRKIKDLLGVFTVQFGIPSLDQFNVPSTPGEPISKVFSGLKKNVKESYQSLKTQIKNSLSILKSNNFDQIETGGLTLKKFLGCTDTTKDFTPKQRIEARKKPEIVQKTIDEETEKSTIALTQQTKDNVKERVIPPAEKSKQEDIPDITDVEKVPPVPWNYYNLRIYATPVAESLTPEVKRTLENAELSIISTGDKPPKELLLFAVKQTNDSSVNDLYKIVTTKDKNSEIALYDPVQYKLKETAIRSLPAGYLIVTLTAENIAYGFDSGTLKIYSVTKFSINAKYKRPGSELLEVYTDTITQMFLAPLESSTNRTDRDAITYYIVGETEPFGAKTPYFSTRLQNKQVESTFRY